MAVALFFTLTFAALAQDKPADPPNPAPAAAPQATAVPASAAETAAPAEKSAPADEAKPADGDEPKLRRLDQSTTAPDKATTPSKPRRVRPSNRNNEEHVSIGHDSVLKAGERSDAVVSIFGSSSSAGDVTDAVVSIMGNTRVTGGTVGDTAVAVLGSTYVNTKVNGEVVAVLGDVELGPDAVVGGDVTSVGGQIIRDPKAVVHGNTNNVAFGSHFPRFDGLQAWFRNCLLLGRPLALERSVVWAWVVAFCFLGVYVLIGLLFPTGVQKCNVTLTTRPGMSVVTALLAMLLAPVVIVLLSITVIGVAAVPFVVVGLFVASLFGKAVLLAWLGSKVTRLLGDGPLAHPAVTILVGGFILLLIYVMPILGFLVLKMTDVLGLGVVVLTVISSTKREKPTTPPASGGRGVPTVPVTPFVPTVPVVPADPVTNLPMASASDVTVSGDAPQPPMQSAGFGAETPPPAATGFTTLPPVRPAPFQVPPVIPPIDLTIQPRAGFWLRIGGLAIDGMLIGVLFGGILSFHGNVVLFMLAAYGAAMWQAKGTTIGGLVCGLQVVRLDGRPIDWATAVVRALSCFVSLVVCGLGFFWIVIDDGKQAWHDKIAGTIVIRAPKGQSLV